MISLIVQKSENNCVGVGSNIPWHIPDIWRKIRSITKKKTLIVGRNTFEILPKTVLRSRNVWVISSDPKYRPRRATKIPSIESALEQCNKFHARKEYIVMGGTEMFFRFMPHVVKWYIFEITGNYYGDHMFPSGDFNVIRKKLVKDEPHTLYRYKVYTNSKCMLKLLHQNKVPDRYNPKKIRMWEHRKNITSRRRNEKARRRAEREVFEFDLMPSIRKIKSFRVYPVNDEREPDLLEVKTYVYIKRNPVGRPPKRKLNITPEERKALVARLNKPLRQILEERKNGSV